MRFIDQSRGLIMLFMALDHALYFWSSGGRISNEGLPLVMNGHLQFLGPGNYTWSGWVAMLMASVCAPGFLFIAGYVLALSVQKRQAAGATSGEITKYLGQRGLLLIVLQILVASPAFNLPLLIKQGFSLTVGTVLSFSILSTFGIEFLLMAGLRFIKPGKLLALTVGVYFVAQYLLPETVSSFAGQTTWVQALMTIFVLPVPFNINQPVNGNFPVLAWFLPLVVGWWFGQTAQTGETGTRSGRRGLFSIGSEQKRFVVSGVLCLTAFVGLRLSGVGERLAFHSFNSFFVLSKYPPGADYFFFYLGLVFFLMAAFMRWGDKVPGGRVVERFGQTPLLFYNAHLWLYAAIPAVLNRFNQFPFWTGVGVWLMGLAVLYQLCTQYENIRWMLRRRRQYGYSGSRS